jgi:ATP-dependent HslUV protease ATP-binding subunit HslU
MQENAQFDTKTTHTDKPDEVLLEKGKAMLPREIVIELDRFIVGQPDAKKAVAVALRNRWRRIQLPSDLRNEVIPKNILMIGPTGVGKTEIARRIAKLVDAPFIKVEATKYTEVGYVGRDVDSIIRDLVEIAINQTRKKLRDKMKEKAKAAVERKLLDLLVGEDMPAKTREQWMELLRAGELDDRMVEAEIDAKMNTNAANPQGAPPVVGLKLTGGNPEILFSRLFTGNTSQKSRKQLPVSEYRPILEEQETEKLISEDSVIKHAIRSVEQDAIVFIDEIDKICRPSGDHHSGDASAEGVQRDLLPIIEGSTINTKHGNIDTSKILFIASGAFHSCKPSDLLAELQGRLPIRVELKGLLEHDLYRILTEPETNLIRQQVELMKTEGLDMQFTDDAIKYIAKVAYELNSTVENIGARRLHTVLEKIIEDISYNCDKTPSPVIINEESIKKNIAQLMSKTDLTKFIL